MNNKQLELKNSDLESIYKTLPATLNSKKTIPHVCWKVDGADRFFKKLTNLTWIEMDQGRQIYSFDFVYEEEKSDTIILYAVDRQFYLKLTATTLTIEKTLDLLNENETSKSKSVIKELYKGTWVEIDHNDYTYSPPVMSNTSGANTDYQYYGYYSPIDDNNKDVPEYIQMNKESLWKREISLLLDKVFLMVDFSFLF